MFLIARSNRTLSGCSVSFEIGASYFLRRNGKKPQKSRTASALAVTTKIGWRLCIFSDLLDPDCAAGSQLGDLLHFLHGCGWIGTMKDGRTRHHPVTPRRNNTLQIIAPNPAIYLDRKG